VLGYLKENIQAERDSFFFKRFRVEFLIVRKFVCSDLTRFALAA